MTKAKIETYRRTAITLWALVSVVAGVTLGAMLNFTGKKLFFVMILAVGLYLLVLMKLYKKEKEVAEDEFVQEAEEKQEINRQEVNKKGGVDEANLDEISKNKAMSPEEAREWLDDFLVNQQKGDGV
jgi:Ca2+/Na+ antiporter